MNPYWIEGHLETTAVNWHFNPPPEFSESLTTPPLRNSQFSLCCEYGYFLEQPYMFITAKVNKLIIILQSASMSLPSASCCVTCRISSQGYPNKMSYKFPIVQTTNFFETAKNSLHICCHSFSKVNSNKLFCFYTHPYNLLNSTLRI